MTDPNKMAITIHVLGHATLSTSERFYNHAMTLKAAEAYQTEIATMRREVTRKARQAARRDRRYERGCLNRVTGD
jgi:hypothetical protein